MRESDFAPVEMSPDEQFAAIANLKDRLEEDFIQMGQILAQVKRRKTYKLKGYKTFKEFMEGEYNMGQTLASRLIGVHEVFVRQLDMAESDIRQIGFDKLAMVKPFVQKKETPVAEQEEWVEKASSLSVDDLREEIREVREKSRDKSVKDIFAEQFKERMITLFNCSAKELIFKLALYFHSADDEEVHQKVRTRQKMFEENQL